MRKEFYLVFALFVSSCSFIEEEQVLSYFFAFNYVVNTSDWEKSYSQITKSDLITHVDLLEESEKLSQIRINISPDSQDTILVHVKPFYESQKVLSSEIFPNGMPVKLLRSRSGFQNILPLVLVWGHVELADSSYNGHIILPISPNSANSNRFVVSVQITFPFSVNELRGK